jgi:hypothetical protein
MTAFRATAILAIILSAFAAELAAEPFIDLDQNWNETDRNDWYDATQGSRLLPASWLEALEQPDSTNLFLADDHIAKFRYLPRPGQLPVGFVRDRSSDELSAIKVRWRPGQTANEQWIGFNCSACHTSEITYQGKHMRVEGGPALADFQGFIETLNRSLIQTRDDPGKFDRFARRVLAKDNDKAPYPQRLKTALSQLIDWQLKIERMNATSLRYGFGRLDAFGHIYNKVVLVAHRGDASEGKPSDAPVSYPFLWNVPQQTSLQWNASAPNHIVLRKPAFGQPVDVGALGRNIGEVIGVFGDIRVTPRSGPPISGYKSSINVKSLVSLEQMLTRLRPPAWPAVFGAPDASSVATGKQLFEARCQTCHAPLDRADLTSTIAIKQSFLGDVGEENRTDPAMSCNAYSKRAHTGVLEGTSVHYNKGAQLEDEAAVAEMLAATVFGAITNKMGAVLTSVTASFFGVQPRPEVVPGQYGSTRKAVRKRATRKRTLSPEEAVQECLNAREGGKAYKARPLNGIWATAPYLHNGSVPTLHDLLLPPGERSKSFHVGSREFDPANVGFVTAPNADNTFLFETQDRSGKIIPGNSNAGHDYGSGLQEKDRQDLLAYLKTL